MNIVLFSAEEIASGKPLAPRDERAKHLLKVLHKGAGDTFEAGVINGMAGKGTITAVHGDGTVAYSFAPLTDGKPLYPVHLVVGFPRPIQLKRLFRDVAGLGVSRIFLCGTDLGEKSYRDSTIVERGAALAALTDGTAQAKSTHVPELVIYDSVDACLAALEAEFAGAGCVEPVETPPAGTEITRLVSTSSTGGVGAGLVSGSTIQAGASLAPAPVRRVVLDNVAPQAGLYAYLTGGAGTALAVPAPALPQERTVPAAVYAAIGSERGWTDRERALFAAYQFVPCSMGSRVLRTETAATVAVSLILQALEIL